MKKLITTLSMIFLIIGIMISSLEFLSFRKSYFHKMYKQLEVAETIGITAAELDYSTDYLLDYINDKHLDLDIDVVVEDESVQMFNQKEKDHMVDVKDLFLRVDQIKNIFLIVGVLGIILSFVIQKKSKLIYFKNNLKYAMIGLFSVLGAIGLFALIDFSSFWILFHETLFTNDLWLLDPRTDRLIMMVPEAFFMGLVYQILGSFVIIFLFIFSLYFFLERKVKYDSRRTI